MAANALHLLPPSLNAEFTAFCAASDLDYEAALREAFTDHVEACGANWIDLALEDANQPDDFIADAVTLWLDEQGGKLKVFYYFDFSPGGERRCERPREGAPSPTAMAPAPRPEGPLPAPGGVVA